LILIYFKNTKKLLIFLKKLFSFKNTFKIQKKKQNPNTSVKAQASPYSLLNHLSRSPLPASETLYFIFLEKKLGRVYYSTDG
jgi:hypothetical protein